MSTGHPHFLQLLDLNDYKGTPDGKLWFNEQEIARGDMCYYSTPYSAPAYVRWTRVLDKGATPSPGTGGQPVTRLLAHTQELDVFTFGVKVFTRIGLDGTLKVFTEDASGREMVASYTKPSPERRK